MAIKIAGTDCINDDKRFINNESLPSVRPSLLLDVVNGNALDQRFSFARSTTATYYDSNGVLQTAAVNTPRLTYDPATKVPEGLLIEEARTNLLTDNVAFVSGWSSAAAAILPYETLAPDGTLRGAKLLPANGTAFHYIFKTYASGTTTSWSVYAKAAGYRRFAFWEGGVTSYYAAFDLFTGTLVAKSSAVNATIQDVGNGWYKCTMENVTVSSGTPQFIINVISDTGTSHESFNANGGDGIYIFGAQLEVGAFPTSYIPSTEAFTSRASTATYYDSNGVMQEAAVNEYRENAYGYDSNGTLQFAGPVLEPSKTNDYIYSENLFLSGISKTRAFIQPYQELGQTGGITAGKFIPDGSAATTHYAAKVVNYTAGTVYTFSVYAKAAELNSLSLDLPVAQFGSAQRTLFDLTDGTASFPIGKNVTHYGSQLVGSGWWRIWITSTCTSSGLGAALLLLFDNDGNVIFDGDYNSGVYVWGAQVEAGSYPSSYILEGTTWSSRASTATYYDSNGIIQTASSGVARDAAYYPKDGVFYPIGRTLIEVASTNLVLYSEALDNAVWSKGGTTITANATTAPDGNTTADEIVMDGLAGLHYAQTSSISFTSGTVYTASIYLKYVDWQYVNMLNTTAVGTEYAVFDLLNGEVVGGNYTRASITDVGNGWFRCEYTFIPVSTTSGVVWPVWFSESASSTRNPSFVGNGSVYAWGAQVESYSPASYTAYYATSYIPTTSSTVTRAADVFTSGAVTRAADNSSSPSVTRAADVYTSTAESRAIDLCTRTPGSEFNRRAFTVYMEATFRAVQTANIMLFDSSSGGLSRDRIVLYRTASGNISAYVNDTSGDSSFVVARNATGELFVKIAMSYDADTGVLVCAANGVGQSVTKILSLEAPNPDTFHIGTQWDNNGVANRPIENLKIYPVALTAAELEAMTE